MCGIAGYVSAGRPIAVERLRAMRDTLIHRGPDDCGMAGWNADGQRDDQAAEWWIGLAHRRLSIIDLSADARQPMGNEDGRVQLVFNGEFYNFEEYRGELEQAGHVFRSRSDTEVLIHLYEEHGIEQALRCMNGMFAFALWDEREQALYFARDRMGQKPLYYTHREDGSLAFASEIKALLASGEVDASALDPVAVDQFWALGYPCGEQTVYRDIKQAAPGTWYRWKAGRLESSPYWEMPMWGAGAWEESLDELADHLESLLSDAIRLRMIADVPVGLFLSGGVDSSLICALAREVAGDRLQTYTVAFEEASHDESHHARAVAEHLGLNNTVLTADGSLYESFDALVRHFDQPFGDFSAIPTWLVCKLAREHVTVALSGDAGDELFGGYDDYQRGMRLWGKGRARTPFPAPSSFRERLVEFKYRRRGVAQGFAEWAQRLGPKHRARIFAAERWGQIDPAACLKPRLAQARASVADPLCTMQRMDLGSYLPDDILVKVDRMSMQHSLECRSPLLDHRIVEFAARLPYRAKMDAQGRGKVLLRTLLARYLPEALYERPKAGFTPPWERWCAGPLRGELRAAWQHLPADWFDPAAADYLLPAEGALNPVLAWNAYSCIRFFEDR